MDAPWQNSDRRREYSISSISVCVTFDLVTRERIQKYQMHGTAKPNVSPLGCATSHLRPANQFRGKKEQNWLPWQSPFEKLFQSNHLQRHLIQPWLPDINKRC